MGLIFPFRIFEAGFFSLFLCCPFVCMCEHVYICMYIFVFFYSACTRAAAKMAIINTQTTTKSAMTTNLSCKKFYFVCLFVVAVLFFFIFFIYAFTFSYCS